MENKPVDLRSYLSSISYPGRGIVIGLSSDGKKAMLGYFIMGRSENSRNRIFKREGFGLRTVAADPAKMTDPSLIIYYPVRVLGDKTIVTNGDQTDTIYDFLERGESFEQALETRCFEPDGPNWTPRISGMIDMTDGFTYKMSILKAADPEGKECERLFWDFEPQPGVGHIIHTYDGDGSPLPSFSGAPRPVKMDLDVHAFSKTMWYNLNEENKVSLFVRTIELESGRVDSRTVNKNFEVK